MLGISASAAAPAAAAPAAAAPNDSGDNLMNAAEQSRNRASQSVAASEKAQGLSPDSPGGRSRTNTSTGKKKETYSSKVSRGGGFAKGGLVSPRAAKAVTPKAKNNNNKKGLGRK